MRIVFTIVYILWIFKTKEIKLEILPFKSFINIKLFRFKYFLQLGQIIFVDFDIDRILSYPVVNFTTILWAAFFAIFCFLPKETDKNCKNRKAGLRKKSAPERLVKLKPDIFAAVACRPLALIWVCVISEKIRITDLDMK